MRYPNFQFVHYDVTHQFLNPLGVSTTAAIRIPLQDRSVDRILVWSVFTHLTKGDIIHYHVRICAGTQTIRNGSGDVVRGRRCNSRKGANDKSHTVEPAL